ncbi:MAG: hypothetical protein WC415_03520 [Patescibacteria group bacterium]|jgi:hypothetical protein
MFLYRDILKKSWKITWGHKYLWFFGLFAALLTGIGRYNVSFSQSAENWNSSLFAGLSNIANSGLLAGNFFSSLLLHFRQDPLAATTYLIFLLTILIISFLLLWLAVVSQGGLINNASKIIKANGKNGKTTIKEGLFHGNKNFWQILGINLIAAAFTSFFAALVGLPLLYAGVRSNPVLALLYVLLFILFIPLALIISFLGKYAVCYKVIKGKSFVDSVVEAINLFGKNWLISIEMSLLLFMVDVLAIFSGALIILSLSVPYRFIAVVAGLIIAPGISLLIIAVGLALALIFVIFAGAALVTFKTIAWTDMFISLNDKKGNLSKIIRLATNLRK